MMLRQGLAPTAIGAAAGLGGALAVARLMTRFLFGVTATDATVFAGATAMLLAAGAVATYLPARRAASIDPMIALRAE